MSFSTRAPKTRASISVSRRGMRLSAFILVHASQSRSHAGNLNAERRSKKAERQRDGEKHDFQNSMNGNADNPEGKQQQPHEGIRDQRQKRKRPAENEEYAPQQEGEHGSNPPA